MKIRKPKHTGLVTTYLCAVCSSTNNKANLQNVSKVMQSVSQSVRAFNVGLDSNVVNDMQMFMVLKVLIRPLSHRSLLAIRFHCNDDKVRITRYGLPKPVPSVLQYEHFINCNRNNISVPMQVRLYYYF